MQIKKRDLFTAFCLAILVFLFLSGILGLFFSKNAIGAYVFALFTYFGGFIIPAALYIVARDIKIPVGIKKESFSKNTVKLIIFSSLLSFLLYIIIKMGFFGMGEINIHKVYFATVFVPIGSVYEIILSAIIFAILPAICEEFIFRNILFEEYKAAGIIPFAVISSLCASFIHFDFSLFIVYVLINIGFCALRIFFKSFYASAISHCIFNLLVIFVEPYIWSFLSRSERKGWFWIVLLAVFFLLSYFSATALQRLISNQSFDKGIKFGKENVSLLITSPTFLLLAAIFVIFTAISGALY